MTDVHVELFDTGSCRQSEHLMHRHASWRSVTIPSYAAAVVHPRAGVVVIDTGYAPRFLTATEHLPGRAHRWATPPVVPFPPALVDQLAIRAIRPDEVRHVVATHAHADHTSGLLDFPEATVHLSGHELPEHWQSMTVLQHLLHSRLVEVFPADLAERTAPVESSPLVPTGLAALPEGHDLLGDGSVLAISLPGHTAGHIGVYLPATQGAPILLVGDAAWHRAAFLADDLPPRVILSRMHNPTTYAATIAALAQVNRHHPEVMIVPAHCSESVALARAALG